MQTSFKIPLWRSLFGSELPFCFLKPPLTHNATHSPPPVKVAPRRKVAKAEPAPVTPVQSSAVAPIVVDEEEETPAQASAVDQGYMSQMTTIFEEEAELYFWDMVQEGFRNDGIVIARISQDKDTQFGYWLTASNDNGILLAHPISSDMNQRFSHKMLSLTWNHLTEDNSQSSWLFRFQTQEDFGNLVTTFTKCLWETLHQIPWGKIKVRSISGPRAWANSRISRKNKATSWPPTMTSR